MIKSPGSLWEARRPAKYFTARANRNRYAKRNRLRQLNYIRYRLFRVRCQMYEWPTNRPHLRRCDSCFLSNQLSEREPWMLSIIAQTNDADDVL